MPLYIDGRFAVNGKESHIDLQRPINITKEIEKVVDSLGSKTVELHFQNVNGFTEDFDDSTPFMVVPAKFNGASITGTMTAYTASTDDNWPLYVLKNGSEDNYLEFVFNTDDTVVDGVLLSEPFTVQTGDVLFAVKSDFGDGDAPVGINLHLTITLP